MKFVWKESTKQAKQMIATWADGDISSVAEDTRTVSLNVLAAAGFRKSFDFQSKVADTAKTDVTTFSTYRDALCTVLDNIILLLVLPAQVLSLPYLPQSFNVIGKAAVDFRKHMERMLQEETASVENGEQGSGGIMTSFVRALKVSGSSSGGSMKSRGLTVEELIGNVFLVNFAGHDTTANTFAFAFYLLASEPKVQQWLAEELDTVTNDDKDWDYEHLYPSLVRCRAVLVSQKPCAHQPHTHNRTALDQPLRTDFLTTSQYETLRMYPPALALPKHTPTTPQRLQVGDREIVIPANVHVQPSLLALHMHPQYWVEPEKWNPQRWITRASEEGADKDKAREALVKPRRGTYFPWSEGPMNCPGRKFSEVEFTAVISCLMRTHRLSIVRNSGESEMQARQRVREVVNDCDNQMLLKMRDPGRVRLRCEVTTGL
jgi:cytochrome P450